MSRLNNTLWTIARSRLAVMAVLLGVAAVLEPVAAEARTTPDSYWFAYPDNAAGTRFGEPIPGEKRHLVWSDEFSGSTLDRKNWEAEDRSIFNEDLACLMDRRDNLKISGGQLHLIARLESRPVQCGKHDPKFPGGRKYTTAHIDTRGLAEFTHGTFVMRARLPMQRGTSKGMWPAFWLRPVDRGSGEIDIFEGLGSGRADEGGNIVHHSLHYDYKPTYPEQTTGVITPRGIPSDGMHTYALDWDAHRVRWYVDKKLTYEKSVSDVPWLSRILNKPYIIHANLAVGGKWPGSPDVHTQFPASYDIDFIRVYQC